MLQLWLSTSHESKKYLKLEEEIIEFRRGISILSVWGYNCGGGEVGDDGPQDPLLAKS